MLVYKRAAPHTFIRCFSSSTNQSNQDKVDDSLSSKYSFLDKNQKRIYNDYMELTKFKLSLLNTVGSYTMFYFHAPLIGVGLLNSALFIFATQTVAMST